MAFVALIIAPAIQFSPRLAQGASPTYSVAIIDYAFQPLHINIMTGTTVVWTYASSWKDFHTVTSDPGTNKTQGGTALLNSGSLSPGQSFSYTFNQPGYYPYQCSFHPTLASMNGWVNVTGPPVTPPSSQNPQPNYILITVIGAVVGAVIIAAIALFVRRERRRTSGAPASTQKAKP
jgi:plastocyanin